MHGYASTLEPTRPHAQSGKETETFFLMTKTLKRRVRIGHSADNIDRAATVGVENLILITGRSMEAPGLASHGLSPGQSGISQA